MDIGAFMSRHWFFTGASSGIGRHLAEIILASGMTSTATVRRPETLDDLAARYGDQLVVERLDVTVKGTSHPSVQRAEARRPVDVLVNNAGGGIIGATEFSDADIEGQISLNLLAPVHVTRAFIPAMRTRRAGRIIQISSASGQGSCRPAVFTTPRNGVWKASANAFARNWRVWGLRHTH